MNILDCQEINTRRVINETELNLDLEIAYEDGDLEFELLDTFKLLTKKEVYIMKLIYVYCLSASEIVTYKNITLGKKYYVKVKPKDKN